MEKILIVDQDEINLLVIEMVLKEIGYDVATITSFGNCINELSSKRYELLLLGLDVSQKNSFKLVEKIRANPDISEVKIIFLCKEWLLREQLIPLIQDLAECFQKYH